MNLKYSASSTGVTLVVSSGIVSLIPSLRGGVLPGVAIGLLGVAVVLAGLYRGVPSVITGGGLCLYFNVLIAGVNGVGAIWLLGGTLGTVVAWDSANNAVRVRKQLLSDTDTMDIELLHVGATTVVIIAAGILAFLASFLVVTPPSVVVIVLLLLTAIILATILTSRELAEKHR